MTFALYFLSLVTSGSVALTLYPSVIDWENSTYLYMGTWDKSKWCYALNLQKPDRITAASYSFACSVAACICRTSIYRTFHSQRVLGLELGQDMTFHPPSVSFHSFFTSFPQTLKVLGLIYDENPLPRRSVNSYYNSSVGDCFKWNNVTWFVPSIFSYVEQ